MTRQELEDHCKEQIQKLMVPHTNFPTVWKIYMIAYLSGRDASLKLISEKTLGRTHPAEYLSLYEVECLIDELKSIGTESKPVCKAGTE